MSKSKSSVNIPADEATFLEGVLFTFDTLRFEKRNGRPLPLDERRRMATAVLRLENELEGIAVRAINRRTAGEMEL
jgi:ATP-dependent DNA ligase